MRIMVSGATGLVGRALVRDLEDEGHRVVCLVRREARGNSECAWDPERGTIDKDGLEGLDVVVHLAGESIAAGRWTVARKARILDSRVQGTTLLSSALAACARKPRVLLSASAIGYYGDRGDEVVNEESAPGTGFLAEVCQAWESAADPARAAGIRVVHPRIGIVLSRDGGALPKMLPAFRLGLGGPFGAGQNYMSWVTLEDLVGILKFAIAHNDLSGPVNAVSPQPVTNLEFSRILAGALRRPAWFAVPSPLVRAALGEMGQGLLLEGARVVPRYLTEGGYLFRHRDLEGALQTLLHS